MANFTGHADSTEGDSVFAEFRRFPVTLLTGTSRNRPIRTSMRRLEYEAAAIESSQLLLPENAMVSTRFLSTSFLVLALGGVLPQLVNADCPNCGAQVTCREKCGWFSGCCRDKCCYQKIVIKHASVAPAPYGYAVASAPVAMVHVPTFSLAAAPVAPYAPAVPAAPAAPQFTAEEVQAFRQWYESQRRAAPVAPAAPSAPTAAAQKCDDPCGQILQLRQDVDQMKVALDKISIAVLKLAEAKNP